jgi:hypothetical protein
MDNKVLIGIVVAIIAIALVVGFFFLSNSEVVLVADDLQVTLPGNYTADSDFSASAGSVNISFVKQKSSSIDKGFYEKFFKTLMAHGKEAGYENITNRTVNDTTLYEFGAHPNNIQNMSSDREATAEGEAWTVYTRDLSAPFEDGVDHFRTVYYIKGDNVYTLYITTTNSTTNLYTPEINSIIDSVAPAEKK